MKTKQQKKKIKNKENILFKYHKRLYTFLHSVLEIIFNEMMFL